MKFYKANFVHIKSREKRLVNLKAYWKLKIEVAIFSHYRMFEVLWIQGRRPPPHRLQVFESLIDAIVEQQVKLLCV
jgi:3-methyladenine DNA glycosylase/8-oxoguanine DNA glycosylase